MRVGVQEAGDARRIGERREKGSGEKHLERGPE